MKDILTRFSVLAVIVLMTASCGGGGESTGSDTGGSGDSGFEDGSTSSGDCAGGGWCGNESITVTADLTGSQALFTIQDTSDSVLDSSSSLIREATISNQSRFYKLMDDGTYEEVISAFSQTNDEASGDLPLLSYIAANGQGDVFVAYEYPFLYRAPPEDYVDPWAPSSPYTCQLFKIESTIQEFSEETGSADGTLCCITNTLELDTWDYRTNKIQFDDAGNAYFTAHVPQNWKNVLIKWDHSATPETDENGGCTYPASSLSEVINANIVFRDYLVVPSGGVFYTGFSSTSGDYHDDDSFLRFKADDGQLEEITSGFWDYIFKPVDIEDSLLGIDDGIVTEAEANERVIFYGPDPLVATSPEWDDSCLYLYDPNASGADRSTEIADCDIDIWNYINWADDIDTRRDRCDETKYLMGGHHQPKRILLADSYDEEGNYRMEDDFIGDDGMKEVYIVGEVYSKKAGEWRYDICVNKNSGHCVDADGVPDYALKNNQAGCVAAGGSWKNNYECYNQLSDPDLLSTLTTGAGANDGEWQVNGQWCENPGGDWMETYNGFARVNYSTEGERSITLLSSDDEIVKDGWAVGQRLFYVSFEVENGTYRLMEAGSPEPILTGYEVYEMFLDPNDANKLYFNGLRFEDNTYVMGTFSPDDAEATLNVDTGLTGQIETLIVIPDELLQ